MKNFRGSLEKKIIRSRQNSFGVENYDTHRFNSYPAQQKPQSTDNIAPISFKGILKIYAKKALGYESKQFVNRKMGRLSNYLDKLQFLWEHLNENGKQLMVDIIAYRLLGYQKVKLPTNNPQYWKALEKVADLKNVNDTYDPHFMHFILNKFDLNEIGYNIKLYFTEVGIAIDYIIEQYAYKLKDEYVVSVKEGDVVLDIGACWGDTALYFADKTGETGKVYSFEFIPDNIKLFQKNIALNPSHLNRIELIEHPVSNKTGDDIFFIDKGPGSKIETTPMKGQTGSTTTIAVDDFVKSKNLSRVDFIKMDIEGAEARALEGAIETIKKYKPKLAIAIYHSIDDFVDIPIWIEGLNLGYKLYIGHYTIHAEETIIFASCS